jgi:hypothetical protein
MNGKIGFALLAVGLVACLGIAASDCINLYTTEWNGEVVSDAKVYVDGIENVVGTTDQNGYLLIPLNNTSFKDTSLTNDNIWNVTADAGNKWGTNWTTVLPGKCENLTIKMSS